MTQINATGATVNIQAVAGSDIVRNYTVTTAGSARDLTNATLEVVVNDVHDNCPPKIIGTYPQTITVAADGTFKFKIPYSALVNREGEEMSYGLFITEGGDRVCLQSGMITIREVV